MFKQVELKYGYSDLESVIDTLTMETHYSKHHAAYTSKFNAAVEGKGLDGKTIEEILSTIDKLPEEIRNEVRNNGGGYFNHNLYFSVMSPNGGGEPTGKLSQKLIESFGSFQNFKDAFSKEAVSRFGSGWAWLVVDENGKLAVTSTSNQDNPLMPFAEVKGQPILAIDVWEHAYYLKYTNKRPDYIEAFYKIIDWDYVGSLYEAIS